MLVLSTSAPLDSQRGEGGGRRTGSQVEEDTVTACH